MRIIALLVSLVCPALGGCAAAGARPAPADRPPNIILIMADDIGAECFGSYGGESYATPRLDALARGGVRFMHCHAQPLCTPTRVQLMTGQSNVRNYVRFGIMDSGERTFGHMLRDAGYSTAVAGKWQLYGSEMDKRHAGTGMHPRDAGFDEYCLWQVSRRGSRYQDPVIERDGRMLDGMEGRYGPDVFTDFICDFIERHRGQPFFVYYPMALTHSPFEPTPDSVAAGKRGKWQNFADMVHYMDKIVGRIEDHIASLGLGQDTVLIFTSDNGTHRSIVSRAGGRQVRGAKGQTTDAGTHVPLIVSWPGRAAAGRVCEDLVDSTDFLPTLLELAGTDPPADRPLDGRSFAPQIRGRPGQPRPWISAYYNPLQGKSRERRWARDQRWKLYATGELFDVMADPHEQSPIIAGTGNQQAVRARGRLLVALASIPAEPAKLRPD